MTVAHDYYRRLTVWSDIRDHMPFLHNKVAAYNRPQVAFSVAATCREALDQDIYGGRAPSDSNALTEIYRTASGGAGFTVETDDGEFGVEIRRRRDAGPAA